MPELWRREREEWEEAGGERRNLRAVSLQMREHLVVTCEPAGMELLK